MCCIVACLAGLRLSAHGRLKKKVCVDLDVAAKKIASKDSSVVFFLGLGRLPPPLIVR